MFNFMKISFPFKSLNSTFDVATTEFLSPSFSCCESIPSNLSSFSSNENESLVEPMYVDDIIPTGSDPISSTLLCYSTIIFLSKTGDLNFFLGLEITRKASMLYLDQHKHIAIDWHFLCD